MKIFRSLSVLLLCVGLFSCDAPRLNPLDPQNPDYQFAALDGFVKTVTGPPQPIAGVSVFWKSQNILLTTDANGYFKLDNLPKQDGWLYFQKDGFSSDSTLVQWNNQKTFHVDMFLHSIPRLDSLAIYTSVENRYPDVQKYKLTIQAGITDTEGNVDSVFVVANQLHFNRQLNYNPSSRSYQNDFSQTDLGLQSMDEGIGKIFNIIVKDKQKRIFNIGSSTIKRIIKQEVLPETPSNKQTVGSTPTLRWTRFLPGFNFRYMVQIYTDEVSPVLVWQKDNISKDDIQVISGATLPAGDYFWVIWSIDDFQDRCRSKPASFVVQ